MKTNFKIIKKAAQEKMMELKKDNQISNAAAALGSIRTPKKAASSRENGKRGGRPKISSMGIRVETYAENDEDGSILEEKWFRDENKSLEKYVKHEIKIGRVGTVKKYDAYENIVWEYDLYDYLK